MDARSRKSPGLGATSKSVRDANQEQTNITTTLHPRVLAGQLDNLLSQHKFYNQPTKRTRMITWLMLASNQDIKVTRFDAEFAGCHCWNTTASEIQRYDGITVERQETNAPTRFGTTYCKEYWLNPSEISKAQNLIESLTIKGGS